MLSRKTLAALIACAVLLAAGAAHGQSARSLALAGVAFPGRDATANPAALAYPAQPRTFEVALPLGALNAVIAPWADPLGDEADYLAIATQLSQLDTLLLIVPRSPETLTVRIDADGVRIDGDGAALVVPERVTLAERLELPVRFSVAPSLELGVRPYANVRLASTLHSSVERDDDDSLRASALLAAQAEADAGVAIELAYGTVVPVAAELDLQRLAVGGRAHVLIGLAYAAADGSAELSASLDGEGLGEESSAAYAADVLLGGLLAGSVGVGAAIDLGVLATLDSDYGVVDVALLVERLGATWWQVERTSIEGDVDTSTETGPVSERLVRVTPFDVTLAAGLQVGQATLDALGWDAELPDGVDPVLAVNLGYGLASGVRAGVATEIGIDALQVRAGAGFDGGWRFGAGVGYDLGPVGLDAALTARQTPLTGTFTLGVAASLRVTTGR